ncbi:MAG: thioesterase family protein [Rhodospirillales bacterium]|nr:thioesterase family protein [Rhodospirillales bacterium]
MGDPEREALHCKGGAVVWQGVCRPEWLDYNGHMNESYYLLIMSWGTDRIMETIGCDRAYRESGQGTLYTLETHIRYFLEVKEGQPLTVTSQVFERDAKRLRLYNRTWAEGRETAVAAAEFLLLHVAGRPPRAAPFGRSMLEALARLDRLQAGLAVPEDAGRGIRLKR